MTWGTSSCSPSESVNTNVAPLIANNIFRYPMGSTIVTSAKLPNWFRWNKLGIVDSGQTLSKGTMHNNMDNSTHRSAARREAVIPFPVEVAALNGQGVHLFVGDGLAGLIGCLVQLGMNLQPFSRTRGGDELHDDHAADQGTATPILGDVAEHSMLDLVPFARAGRKVSDMQSQPQFIGQALEFRLPQAHPRAIASAPVGGGQDLRGRRLT